MGYKVKFCENCRKAYIPTGPRQRYCDSCRPKVANTAAKVADTAGINALRSAAMKQAKKDGAIDRMIDNGAAAQLFPGTDPEYIRRLANEEKAKPLDGFTEYQPPEEEPLVFITAEPEEKKEEEMKHNYRMVEPDDVWPALIEGQTVLAVDLAARTVTNMQDIRVGQVNEYRQDPDVFFYVPVGEEADDGGEA